MQAPAPPEPASPLRQPSGEPAIPALRPAPELDVVAWLNTPAPIRLADLRGRVVVLEAFQMLCPGCTQIGLPQLTRVREQFPPDELAVLGLHTVFEHHEAQGSRAALEAFLHEYRYTFPVGIDRSDDSGRGPPVTMRAFGMQGTPTLILIDRQGRLRRQTLGHLPDLRLGAEIMSLILAGPDPAAEPSEPQGQARARTPRTRPAPADRRAYSAARLSPCASSGLRYRPV